MSEQEKMNAYIDRTKIKNVERYTLRFCELCALYEIAESGKCYDALILAFRYGRTKGYRLAKSEVKHGKNN